MAKQTSDTVSSKVARILSMDNQTIRAIISKDDMASVKLLDDIRSGLASALSQDETKGKKNER